MTYRSSEADSPATSQEILCLSYNPPFYCRFHKNLPLDLIIDQSAETDKEAICTGLATNLAQGISSSGLLNCSIYTGCPRRNVPDFGKVFLMLKYTDITQNTYIQSWTVMEIMARENCGLLAVPRTLPAQLMQSAGQVQYAFSRRPALLIQLCSRLIPKCSISKR